MGGRRWTKEEDARLKELLEDYPPDAIARRLNRTMKAVCLRSRELGLGTFLEHSGYMCGKQVTDLLHLHACVIKRQWLRRGFKMKKVRLCGNHVSYVVSMDYLLKFLEKNQDLFTTIGLEPYALGMEPEWLINKRREELKKRDMLINHKRRYTAEEDQRIIRLLDRGMTCIEIAEDMNRTKYGIRQRVARLEEQGKIINRPRKWCKKASNRYVTWMDSAGIAQESHENRTRSKREAHEKHTGSRT